MCRRKEGRKERNMAPELDEHDEDGIGGILTDSEDEDDLEKYHRLIKKRPKRLFDELKKLEIEWAEGGNRLKSRLSKKRTEMMKIVESDMHAILVASRFLTPMAALALFPICFDIIFKRRTNVVIDFLGALFVSFVILSFSQTFYFRSAKRRLRDKVKEIRQEKEKVRRRRRNRLIEEVESKEATVSPFL